MPFCTPVLPRYSGPHSTAPSDLKVRPAGQMRERSRRAQFLAVFPAWVLDKNLNYPDKGPFTSFMKSTGPGRGDL